MREVSRAKNLNALLLGPDIKILRHHVLRGGSRVFGVNVKIADKLHTARCFG